jgi:hypothetical protein
MIWKNSPIGKNYSNIFTLTAQKMAMTIAHLRSIVKVQKPAEFLILT